MINEEISRRAITIVYNVAKPRAEYIISVAAKLLEVTKDTGAKAIKSSYKN